MFDDFDIEIQSDEIIPEEYEDWVRYCAEMDKAESKDNGGIY